METAEQQLTTTKSNLVELQGELSEAERTAQLYQSAREQLALEQAENETYAETIARLKTEMDEEAKAMVALENSLQSQLSQLNQEKEKLVTQLEDGTTAIKLPESILFASGSAKLNDDGLKALNVLSDALQSFPNHLISIQGHTDSKKISSSISEIYPTNWELSTARASSAVRELVAKGILAEKIQAVGFADTRPLVKEVDAQSRQQNRRIEVILFPNKFTTRLLEE
jgi:chemotaxis protein MotB